MFKIANAKTSSRIRLPRREDCRLCLLPKRFHRYGARTCQSPGKPAVDLGHSTGRSRQSARACSADIAHTIARQIRFPVWLQRGASSRTSAPPSPAARLTWKPPPRRARISIRSPAASRLRISFCSQAAAENVLVVAMICLSVFASGVTTRTIR